MSMELSDLRTILRMDSSYREDEIYPNNLFASNPEAQVISTSTTITLNPEIDIQVLSTYTKSLLLV